MVNIELTPLQAEELKKFYALELENLQKRADEISRLVSKLDSKSLNISKPSSSINKVKLKTKDKELQQEKSFRNKTRKAKKANWSKFILNILKEQNKPLTSKEILQFYEKKHNIDIFNSKKSIGAFSQALRRLRVNNHKIYNIRVEGKKEKLYGLIKWMDKPGTSQNKEIPQQTKAIMNNDDAENRDFKKTLTLIKKNSKAKLHSVKPDRKLKVNAKQKSIIKQDNKTPLANNNNWPKFIFETLNKTKRVLSAVDLLKYAMVYFSLPKHEMASTRVKLEPELSNLEKIVKSLKTCRKAGKSARFYGLPTWFDDNNELIVDYK